MTLTIAGGCGEHGRNCFYVKGSRSFLVDAGIGEDGSYPDIPLAEISSIEYLFLTHSHKDHTGAIGYLIENGFKGRIIASGETLCQIAIDYQDISAVEDNPVTPGLAFTYGRSGHCPGGLWFQFSLDGRTLFFSGDYREDDPVFIADPVRGICADIAVIDSAYGYEHMNIEALRVELVAYIKAQKLVLLPVPLYGRGLSILSLLVDIPCFGDEHFLSEYRKHINGDIWCKGITAKVRPYSSDVRSGVVFISDPQLKKSSSIALAERVISEGGAVVITGHPDKYGMADRFLCEGRAVFMRYPVHQCYDECTCLSRENDFGIVIPYHSKDIAPECMVYTL